MLYNIRSDPFERGPSSFMYGLWNAEHVWVQVPVQGLVAKWIETFKEFPPRNKAASFTVGDVMDKITTASANQN